MTEREKPQPRRGLPRLRADLGRIGRFLSPRGKEQLASQQVNLRSEEATPEIPSPRREPVVPQPTKLVPEEAILEIPSTLPVSRAEPLRLNTDVNVSIKVNATDATEGVIQVGSAEIKVSLNGDARDIEFMLKYSLGLFTESAVARAGSEIIVQDARREIAADREMANENARRRLKEAGFDVEKMDPREYASCVRYADLHPDIDPKALNGLISKILPQVSKSKEESQSLVDEEHH